MEIKEAIEDYLVEIEVRGYSKKTIRTYGIKLNIFLRYCEEQGVGDIDDVRLPLIKKFTQFMLQRGNKGTYINGCLKTIKSFCQYCYDEGYGAFNTKGGRWTSWVKEKKPHITAFNPKQVRALLAGCQGNKYTDMRDYCLIVMFLETGIRCAEAYGITMKDVHDGYIIVHGKGNKDRLVAVTPILKKAMLKYERARENYFALRPAEDYYFLSYTGKMLTNSGIEHIIKKRGELIEGDVRISPHTLRHTFAQRQLKMGNVDIYTLSKMLGHEDISTTQIYLRSISDMDIVKMAKGSSVLMNMR